jgi:hypothetical protein
VKPTPQYRYTRLTKNLVIQPVLADAVREYDLTGRDLYVLIALLAEAQRRSKRRLVFGTKRELLTFLEWRTRGEDYDALERALQRLSIVALHFERYHDPVKLKEIEDMPLLSRTARAAERQRRLDQYSEERIARRLLRYNTLPSGGWSVVFTAPFWELVCGRGFFLKAYPAHIRHLRNPADMLLYMLIDAYDGLNWGFDKLAERMALDMRTKPEFEARIRKSLKRITAVTDMPFDTKFDTKGGIAQVAAKGEPFATAESDQVWDMLAKRDRRAFSMRDHDWANKRHRHTNNGFNI